MTKYYRPPQGKYSEANLQMAKELGYKSFFWSLAYVDWYQDNQPSKKKLSQTPRKDSSRSYRSAHSIFH